jgi:hypothetical protein
MSRPNKSTLPRWKHQAHEYQIGRDKRSRAFIWPMRSGKTRGCIDVACYQHGRGKIEGVIVIAPNGVHMNWAMNEIPTWGWTKFDHRAFTWETGKRGFPEKEKDWAEFLQHDGLRWFCINMESLRRDDCKRYINEFLKVCHRKFMLIVSEAHHFGRAGAKRTHKARSLSYHAAYVRTETGTPILTGPLRAYSQYELLAPGALGFTKYAKFEEYFADMIPMGRPGLRTRTKVDKYKNLGELTEKISKWSSLVLRDDLGDMPELIRTERPVVMSDAQRKAYIQMVAVHLAEVEDTEVTAKDAGPRMMKLQQILSGYVMDTSSGRILTIDEDAPIYDAVIDEIRGTLPGKALVWCRYKEDCRRLAHKLKRRRMPVLQYWGDFSTTEREANRARFLSPDDDSTMIGTPDCGGEGLDFSAADAVIFMSGNPNARMMAQAEERATVKGGKSVAIVRIRHYGTVDDRIWQIVDGNISLADTITGRGLRKLLEATDI